MDTKTSLLVALAAALLSSCAPTLRVAFVGDPQVDSERDLGYARKSIYKEIRDRKDLDAVFFLGDMVNDKDELLAPTVAVLDSLGQRWYTVPGNHDRDMNVKPRTLENYRNLIGYVDTSFVAADVRFVLMNNVRSIGAGYHAGLSESQKNWLSSLAGEKGDFKRTVIVTHIPFSDVKGAALDSIRNVLKDFSDLMLVCGHKHYVRRGPFRLTESSSVEEVVAGASCGTWWKGPKDEDGVPYAIQNCGAPKGYLLTDFAGGSYKMKYVPTGKDKSEYSLSLTDDGKLVLNVYAGCNEAVVRIQVDGKWIDAAPYDGTDPEVQRIIDYQKAVMTKEFRKENPDLQMALRKFKSPHLWYVPVQAAGKSLKVRIDYSEPSMRIKSGYIRIGYIY